MCIRDSTYFVQNCQTLSLQSLHLPNLFSSNTHFLTGSFDHPFASTLNPLVESTTFNQIEYFHLNIKNQTHKSQINQLFLDLSFNKMCKSFGNLIDKSQISDYENKKKSFEENFAEQGTLLFPQTQYVLIYGGLHYDFQEPTVENYNPGVDACSIPTAKTILSKCNKETINQSFENLDFFSDLDSYSDCLTSNVFLINLESKIVSKLEVQNLSRRFLHCGCLAKISNQSIDSNLQKYVFKFSK